MIVHHPAEWRHAGAQLEQLRPQYDVFSLEHGKHTILRGYILHLAPGEQQARRCRSEVPIARHDLAEHCLPFLPCKADIFVQPDRVIEYSQHKSRIAHGHNVGLQVHGVILEKSQGRHCNERHLGYLKDRTLGQEAPLKTTLPVPVRVHPLPNGHLSVAERVLLQVSQPLSVGSPQQKSARYIPAKRNLDKELHLKVHMSGSVLVHVQRASRKCCDRSVGSQVLAANHHTADSEEHLVQTPRTPAATAVPRTLPRAPPKRRLVAAFRGPSLACP
jgi:hypothetical protein